MPDTSAVLIQRTSANDLMGLATEYAGAPMQIGAILVLDRPVDLAAVRTALAERIVASPRFRQKLQQAPFGCGRPVWVDDATFSIDDHVAALQCPVPGDEVALLEVAAAAAVRPLPRSRPLWSVTVVRGLSGNRTGIVFVVHHVLADGIGGLAALGSLLDGAPAAPVVRFPAQQPSASQLFADATRSRIRTLGHWPAGWRLIRNASMELRGGHANHPTPSSLNQPIGPHRQLAVARADLAALSLAAHAHNATINDILLTAVSGALAATLQRRGEPVSTFVFSVPVSGRSASAAAGLGNHVGAMLVDVCPGGESSHQLAAIAETTRGRRSSFGRGASAVLLGPAFRLLTQVNAFRWFVEHQRIVTTFVTNLRGSPASLSFVGATVSDIIPVTQISGNVTISFAALSYAGRMAITMIADPDHCADLDSIHRELQSQLDLLTSINPVDPFKPPDKAPLHRSDAAPKTSFTVKPEMSLTRRPTD